MLQYQIHAKYEPGNRWVNIWATVIFSKEDRQGVKRSALSQLNQFRILAREGTYYRLVLMKGLVVDED